MLNNMKSYRFLAQSNGNELTKSRKKEASLPCKEEG